MLPFGGGAMSTLPQRSANANVSRWKSEYEKVLARRSACENLTAKQVEAKEPTATTDNDFNIISPAKVRRVHFEQSATITDLDEDLIDEVILEATNKSRSASEALPKPNCVNPHPKKRQKTVDDTKRPSISTTAISKKPRLKTQEIQIEEENNHKTQSTDGSQTQAELPAYAPPRRVPSHDVNSIFKKRHVIETADTPHRRFDQQINRGHLQEINIVKSYIQNVIQTSITQQGDLTHDITILRHHIQKLEYFDNVNELLIHRSHVLKQEGLPRIYSPGNKLYFPEDIIVDAKRLVRRWEAGQFNAFIDRGIKHEKLALGQGKTRWTHSLKFIENGVDYHRAADVQGHNGLDNGQWWQSRLAVLRDGAHGEIEAGISGATSALAIVLSAQGYANVDNGDEIEYVGTPGEKGEPSRGTKLLDSSLCNRIPIRVLRSANRDSKYAPKAGVRYDGLYRIVSMKSLDPDRFLNSYKLQRLPGQAPIRFEGPAIRPSSWELLQLDVLRSRFN
ncbi:hypothetical protein ACMFMG_002484 [Clarireedia jacksonii]